MRERLNLSDRGGTFVEYVAAEICQAPSFALIVRDGVIICAPGSVF